jgi:hypothetical protein
VYDESMMSRRFLALALALTAAACTRRERLSATDSAELARDLALATTQAPAYPELKDIPPAAAPEQRKSTPTPPPQQRVRSTAAARRTTPAPTPRPRPAAPVQEVEQPVAPAPEPAPRFRGFNAGSVFAASTKTSLCTTNLPGDKIVATTTETMRGENGAVIPAGTTVVLEVASVTPGDTPQSAQITLRVRSIDINDEPVSAPADVAILSGLERREVPRDKGSDRRKVVGGAVAGAVIGQIMGRDTRSTVIGAAAGAAAGTAAAAASRKYDACLPAGSTVRITTSQPIAVNG